MKSLRSVFWGRPVTTPTNSAICPFYLVRWFRQPDQEQLQLLAHLLNANPTAPVADSKYVYVAPHSGTVSMWSSQATTIINNCGIEALRRVERGSRHEYSNFVITDSFGWYNYDPLIHQCTESLDKIIELVFAKEEQEPDESVIEIAAHNEVSIEGIQNTSDYFGLGLEQNKIKWIAAHYNADSSTPVKPSSKHQPTASELMTFAQFHSEHCRHNTFHAKWRQNGKQLPTLFDMIRSTTADAGQNVLSAYKDNASVTKSYQQEAFYPDKDSCYQQQQHAMHTIMKVETHNHPTAICPDPGAATGAGGELRDEAATGRGAKPVAGMVGYCTSDLALPHGDDDGDMPPLAHPLTIICQAPLGAANYNNEFGRPTLCGYFRSYQQIGEDKTNYGYHKPIMIAGGHGAIAETMIHKQQVAPGQMLLVLGGAALRVGIGGGSASSDYSGANNDELAFASVQRAHAEIQRRCQEVINSCWQLGKDNPILSIHDVGAGGLANAIPEILEGRGININIARVPVADKNMNAFERWCNESQERFVFTIDPSSLELVMALCERERAPCAKLGTVSEDDVLRLRGLHQANGEQETGVYIETSMQWLHTPLPEPARELLATGSSESAATLPYPEGSLSQLVAAVLKAPTVADKSFLITIADRSVGGLSSREQMVGPWQVAVSDCAVSAHNYNAYTGTAMAVGERPPIAVNDAGASARMAIAEAITNICAARILQLEDISLSANWMVAGGYQSKESELFEAVAAACRLCRQLGIPIPVGKDSLSMRTRWQTADNQEREVISPLSLVATAFAKVADIRNTLTPQIYPDHPLLLIEAGHGQNRLGGSMLRQISSKIAYREAQPDCDAATISSIFEVIQVLNDGSHLLAYHDRSDGGLIACLCEMAFAGHCGLEVELQPQQHPIPQLFSEELGVVVQVPQESCELVLQRCREAGLRSLVIANTTATKNLSVNHNGKQVYAETLQKLRSLWSTPHKQIRQRRGDNQDCVNSEFKAIQQPDPMLFSSLQGYQADKPAKYSGKPALAVLREQGVNGHMEMAAAFTLAGFACHDVHMNDFASGKANLDDYRVLAVPGGFSYGDVLGAGRGWAMSILCQPHLRDQFERFFARPDTLTLGLCNGCQMLSLLRELIPGSAGWGEFTPNRSRRFEGRTVMVSIPANPSPFLTDMHGWQLPVPVAHGEGRLSTENVDSQCLHYIDSSGQPTTQYPANPAGSAAGIAGLCSTDGRVTMLMPHPERAFLNWQFSWHPPNWHGQESPWLKMFQNARKWVQQN
ncbi:MAG: phosphoribosylformylglycinamidine synthase [Candidatus Porifericomitaceae bacterium WSBS_2022_MAG_OTU9]